ncbi:MAG: monovalent cation/H+ antiporter complex subunit F [Candidatus Hydrothermia bacterium]
MASQVHGIAIYAFIGIVGLALILATVRFLLGPTASDRVVATDILTTMTTIILVLIALLSGRSIYLDVALVYAVLSFIAVVAIARYMEGGL